MIINYDHVMKMLEWRRTIDRYPLEEIEWVRDDGTKIEVHPELIADWKLVGLGNTGFAEHYLTDILNGKLDELLKEIRSFGKNTNETTPNGVQDSN